MFEFESTEVRHKFLELLFATDGTENCYDPELVAANDELYKPKMGESVTDLFVENWTNQGVSDEQAAALCAGCHVIEQCRAYARAAGEKHGVWGGEGPRQRGIKRRTY